MQKKQKKYINLVNSINYIIRKKNLIRPGESVLLTISGGQDSISLLFIFLQLKNHWNLSLGIIYCNHLWQSEFFYTTSLLVKLAYLFKLPFYFSVTSKKILTEQKARNWRYKMFQRLCFMSNYPLIITGHTATDRVETVLFQFTRGTSANGFFCLNWSTEFFKNNNFTTFYSGKSIPLVEKINPKSTKENIFLMFHLESMKFMSTNKNLRFIESKNSKKIYEFVDFLNCSKVLKHLKESYFFRYSKKFPTLEKKEFLEVKNFFNSNNFLNKKDYFFFPTLGWLLNQCFFYFLLSGGSFFFF